MDLTKEKQDFIHKVRDAGREAASSVPVYDQHAREYNGMYNGDRWHGPTAVTNVAMQRLQGLKGGHIE